MRGIGGNITADIQVVTTTTKNEIGEHVREWETVQSITGWLDMQSGETRYVSFNAKIQESSHVFVSDFIQLDNRIKAENSRMIINGERYDIKLIDNPVGMNQQLEFYLNYTGGQ